jgi:hypothetical protein
MLSPTPSLSADAELLKKAYVLTNPTFGLSNQVVVAVMDVLPALLALPGIRLKLTACAERLTLTESVKTAFNAIGWAAELRTCAGKYVGVNKNRVHAAKPTICVRKLITGSVGDGYRRTSSRAEAEAPALVRLRRNRITESLVPECSTFRYKYSPEAAAMSSG